jgi:hypothetical protein
MRQDAMDWAVAEFRGVPGLEKRFQDRLVQTAAALADRPAGSLPERFAWPELKGTYRLIHAAAHHPDTLQDVHRDRTRQRMEATPEALLIVHDSTVLSFSHHPAVRDQLGPITDSQARGFIQHNSLVVNPQHSQLLGLIHQQTFCRRLHPAGETRAGRYHRADRESRVWTEGVQAVGRMPPGACWVHVGDRAADFFGMMATAREHDAHFLIRLVQNRVATALDDAEVRVMEAARAVAATTTGVVEVASRGGRPGRTASVCLGAVRLTVRPPKLDPLWRSSPPLTITVVRIWEPNPPPNVEPLEWILGTDRADQSPEALQQYRVWYEWRWPTMEEYHKVQKSGCGIEDLRFETKERLQAAIAILSVVAVRVLSLRWMRDSHPEASAEVVATEEELEVLHALAPHQPPIRTVKRFVDRVAGLGGFLGRKCDGAPGWQTLWRGYQRLGDLVLGVGIARTKPKPPKCG